MAITGTLPTLFKEADPELFESALSYLESTDLDEIFKNVKIGSPVEIQIEGRAVFAVFQTYETKPIEEALMEGHKQYIDIQYIHKGNEQILVTPKEKITKPNEYNDTKDVYFPEVEGYSCIRLSEGQGCILYPDDIHAPGVRIETPTQVQKIVVKVAIQ
nr:YhcH/YjgK/YiaL family protein [uncultured Carboxylicivirga sp.]